MPFLLPTARPSLALFATLVLVSLGARPALADGRFEHPTLADLDAQQVTAGEQPAERAQKRDTPAARAERRRSRRAFLDVSEHEATDLARTAYPELFSGRDRRLLTLGAKQRVLDYPSDTAAIVDVGSGGRNAVVSSTVPLRARGVNGLLQPVDLDLVRTPGGFTPRASSSGLRLGRDAGHALSLAPFGFGVAGSQAPGQRVANEIFYTDAQPATDLWLRPVPTGAEFVFQLRSAESPQTLRLQLQGAPGLRLQTLPGDVVEVLRADRRAGLIGAPAAFDADRQAVPVTMRAEGDELVLDVAHRGQDVRYPIAVDPLVENQDSWKDGNPNNAGWRYYSSGVDFRHSFDRGYVIERPANQLFAPGFAEYEYYTPGADPSVPAGNSYIYRADFLSLRFDTGDNPAGSTRSTQGIWSRTSGRFEGSRGLSTSLDESDRSYSACAAADCSESAGTDGNYALFSLGTSVGTYDAPASVSLGGALIWASDRNDPTVGLSPAPSGWVGAVPAGSGHGADETHADAGDIGLGMRDLVLDVPGLDRQSSPTETCAGGTSQRCPAAKSASFSLAGIAEGIQAVTATATDVPGHTGTATQTYRIDRSPPVVTAVSGTLRQGTVGEGSQSLHVEATDGDGSSPTTARSGGKAVEVRVSDENGTRTLRSPDRPCPGASCGLSEDFSVSEADLGGNGTKTITVVAVDQIDNASDPAANRFTVVVDRPVPATTGARAGSPTVGATRAQPPAARRPHRPRHRRHGRHSTVGKHRHAKRHVVHRPRARSRAKQRRRP